MWHSGLSIAPAIREELVNELDRRAYAERGEVHLWKRVELGLLRSVLVWPEELSFQMPLWTSPDRDSTVGKS